MGRRFRRQHVGEGRCDGGGDGQLGGGVGQGWSGGEPAAELGGGRSKVGGGDDPRHQAPLGSLLDGERFAEEDQLTGPRRPDGAHERRRQAGVARQPDRRERRRQASAGGGNAEVARQRQAEPSPDARSVDRRQDRLGHRRQDVDDGRVVLLDRGECRGRVVGEVGGMLGKVLAGTERAAGARQHHGADFGVLAGRDQCRQQLRLQLGSQRVAAIGAIEGDRRE